MKNAIIASAVSVLVLLLAGWALAHEQHRHGVEQDEAKMQKLHTIMPMYAVAHEQIKAAIERRDRAVVVEEADRILQTMPDLKFGNPHRNLKELKKFKDIAQAFEDQVKAIARHAERGDFGAARAAFARADEQCKECHRQFR